ncbi:histidine phosphatase superfamily (branch 1) domain-containing protein [Ditylenchus destructor]|uniref:Histidine phosphatase superfamily (Branch 1) domain-containing protein n=1 Tax=Ditylenchus destructor TaxID=166010 RepID=A0AAD4MYS4_9BILA|nr:histidine phosphatase superfamily (branch 1) domain-containing protein [Ditylenchus destructor]
MPLNIDIAFKWMQKKDGDGKKDDKSQKKQTEMVKADDAVILDPEESNTSNSSTSSSGTTDDSSAEDTDTEKKSASRKIGSSRKDLEVSLDDGEEEDSAKDKPKVSVARSVIIVRHGERMDSVFPAWQRHANVFEEYQRYDANQPISLVERRGGMTAFMNDPPLTSMGRMKSQLVAQSLRRFRDKITGIYCSPSLRCVQTGAVIHSELKRMGVKNVPLMKIEPALFDYMGWYMDGLPLLLTNKEMILAGFPIEMHYKPIIDKDQLMRSRKEETFGKYYSRSEETLHKILHSDKGTILIVGHSSTIDSTVRGVLQLPRSVPSIRQMDTLSVKYPFTCSVVLEEFRDFTRKGQWRVSSSQLLPVTTPNETSRLDYKFLLRA